MNITFAGKVKRWGFRIPLQNGEVIVIDDFGRSSTLRDLLEGRDGTGVLLPLDLHLRISIVGSRKALVSASTVVRTDDKGRFSFDLDIGDLDGLAPVAAFRASVEAYLPPARQEPFSVSGFLVASSLARFPGSSDERIYAAAQELVANVEFRVDTRGMRRTQMALVPMPQQDPSAPFEDMPNVTVELRSTDPSVPPRDAVFGVAPAPGDANTRTVDMVHVEAMPDHYLRVGRGLLDEFVLGENRVLARTQAQPARTGAMRPQRPAIIRIREDVGIGTISSGIPEEMAVAGTPVVARNIDLDFVINGTDTNRVLRIRADVGIGWEEDDGGVFMAFGIGQFTGRYGLDTNRPDFGPFAAAEIDELLQVEPISAGYDLLPGTDVDELVPGGMFGLENAIAGMVNDRILPRVRANFRDRVNDAIDERREEAEENDPLNVVPGIFATMFLQAEPLRVTADEARLRARVGFWSPDLDLATGDIDCPANATAMAAPRLAVRPAAKRVERYLERERMAGWRALLDAHRKELLDLVKSDPKTTVRLATLIARTHGVLDGSRSGLTADEIASVEKVFDAWMPKASEGLRVGLTAVRAKLPSLIGAPPEALGKALRETMPGEARAR